MVMACRSWLGLQLVGRFGAGGVVASDEQAGLVGDVGQGGQGGGDAALVTVDEVLDVLVQAAQAQPVGQVDRDQRPADAVVTVGDEPEGDRVDIATQAQAAGVGQDEVADDGQEAVGAWPNRSSMSNSPARPVGSSSTVMSMGVPSHSVAAVGSKVTAVFMESSGQRARMLTFSPCSRGAPSGPLMWVWIQTSDGP